MLNTIMKFLGWTTVSLMIVIITLAVTGLSQDGVFMPIMGISLQAMHVLFAVTAIYFCIRTAKQKMWLSFSLVLAAITAFLTSFVLLLFNVRLPMPVLLAFDVYVLVLYIVLLVSPGKQRPVSHRQRL